MSDLPLSNAPDNTTLNRQQLKRLAFVGALLAAVGLTAVAGMADLRACDCPPP